MQFYSRTLTLTFSLLLLAIAIGAQTAASSRIAIIDSSLFTDEKAGITKIVNAVKGVEAQFASTRTELTGMRSRFDILAKEIDTLRNQPAAAATLQRKLEEATILERDIKRKTEDASALYESRNRTALQPIQQALFVAINEYAKSKGYALIFDAAKDSNGMLIAIGDQSLNVTKDFITFFNARP